ncbi:signal peptidase II [Cellulomonas cellasea]|uniref:Lipoprotein signal peptidase n=1 Tax=Cellulomonas cellasea TaxID=43670 RepID=A0A4Y3KUW3_9CELL|nr:signal peptidase II [Cellulomonas cellasea]GEA88241.1 lipoprotein signal peptidase [Cellulomonas cellasea]
MSTTPEVEPTPDRTDPARRRRLLTLLTSLTVGVLALDQLTKVVALRELSESERVPLVGDLLGLRLVFNPGAALSIANGQTWLLTVVATAVVVVVIRASRRLGSRGWAVAFGLLLGGALGNLVDRFFREPGVARGHVVDFIAYGNVFVGNVADIAIVGAAGLIMLLAVRGIALDGTREHAAAAQDAAGDAGDPADADATPGEPVAGTRAAPAAAAGPLDGPVRTDG